MSSDSGSVDNSILSMQELLIELVRARPCLYDKSNREYCDTRGVKDNEWRDVCTQLVDAGFLEEEAEADPPSFAHLVKKKWENIRDAFKKSVATLEKTTQKSGAGTRGRGPKPYKYRNQMEWYLSVNKKKRTTTNRCQESVPVCVGYDQASTSETQEWERPASRSAPTPPSQSSTPPIISPPTPLIRPIRPTSRSQATNPAIKRKRSLECESVEYETDAAILTGLSKADTLMQAALDKMAPPSAPVDIDVLFGNMIGEEMKLMPVGYQKDCLKLEIQQLIMKYKYNNTQQLPQQTHQQLPQQAHQQLPQPTQQHLPQSTQQHLPQSTQQQLPQPTQQHLPQSTQQLYHQLQPQQHYLQQSYQPEHHPQQSHQLNSQLTELQPPK